MGISQELQRLYSVLMDSTLASASWDDTIRLWNVAHRNTYQKKLTGHTLGQECLRLVQMQVQTVASGSRRRTPSAYGCCYRKAEETHDHIHSYRRYQIISQETEVKFSPRWTDTIASRKY